MEPGMTIEQALHQPIKGTTLTGFINADAVGQIKCVRCNVFPGTQCVTPKGRAVWPPHSVRLTDVTKRFGKQTWEYRVIDISELFR